MEPVVSDRQPVRGPGERRRGGVRRRRGQEALQVLHQPHATGRRQRVPRLILLIIVVPGHLIQGDHLQLTNLQLT